MNNYLNYFLQDRYAKVLRNDWESFESTRKFDFFLFQVVTKNNQGVIFPLYFSPSKKNKKSGIIITEVHLSKVKKLNLYSDNNIVDDLVQLEYKYQAKLCFKL